MTTRDTDWDGVRLHVVTGKGGTGKTTVAAALALALASAGRKVLLIEVEGRQSIARLFDARRSPTRNARSRPAWAPGSGPGGDVYALAVDPEGALLDYLESHTAPHGQGADLAFLVGSGGSRRAGRCSACLDLDQQDLTAGAGQGERQRRRHRGLAGAALPVTTCSARRPSRYPSWSCRCCLHLLSPHGGYLRTDT